MAAPNQEKPKGKDPRKAELEEESLVRLAGYDIPGSKKLYPGLTRVKGVSWAIANATCKLLKIPHDKKISELSKDELQKIESFLKDPQVKDYLKKPPPRSRNRKKPHI